MKNFERKGAFFFLFLIILAAGFLRLYHLAGLSCFTYDQARDALYIKRMIVDHKFRLIGTQSSIPGLYTPPFYYYLMAPFLWLFGLDPTGIDFATALMGVLTVVLIYCLLRQIECSWRVSALVSALYAFQPAIVYQSRFAWNPNTIPFFVVLAIFSFFKILADKEKLVFYFLLFFSLGVVINLHYSGIIFSLAFLLLFLWQRHKLNWGKMVLGGIAFLFLLSPLFLFDLRHNFLNTQGLVNYFLHNPRNEAPPPPFLTGLTDKYQFLLSLLLPVSIGSFWFSLFGFFSFFVSLFYFLKKKDFSLKALLSLFFLCLLFSSLYRRGFYSFYLTFLYPIPFLILAKIVSLVRLPVARRGLIIALLLILVKNFSSSLSLVKKNPVNLKGQLKQVSAFLADKVISPFNLVAVYADYGVPERFGHNGVDYRYFLETIYHQASLDWNPLDYEQAQNLYLISEVGETDPLKSHIWEVSLFGPKKVKTSWKLDNQIVIYHLVK
jgi:4-amino-4-deoxy-L-arabinose transferase-like glycosyltransferase